MTKTMINGRSSGLVLRFYPGCSGLSDIVVVVVVLVLVVVVVPIALSYCAFYLFGGQCSFVYLYFVY